MMFRLYRHLKMMSEGRLCVVETAFPLNKTFSFDTFPLVSN